MKYLKLYENFNFNEDDFDFEEEEEKSFSMKYDTFDIILDTLLGDPKYLKDKENLDILKRLIDDNPEHYMKYIKKIN